MIAIHAVIPFYLSDDCSAILIITFPACSTCFRPSDIVFRIAWIRIDSLSRHELRDIFSHLYDTGNHFVSGLSAHIDLVTCVGAIGKHRRIDSVNTGVEVLYENIIITHSGFQPLLFPNKFQPSIAFLLFFSLTHNALLHNDAHMTDRIGAVIFQPF